MHPTGYRRLRAPEAASYLGLSSSTLAKMRLRGDGPTFLKLNRVVAYDIRDLDAWLAIRRRTSTSDRGQAA
jgi:predicted DNA-binding transcriptional regulator AlpA